MAQQTVGLDNDVSGGNINRLPGWGHPNPSLLPHMLPAAPGSGPGLRSSEEKPQSSRPTLPIPGTTPSAQPEAAAGGDPGPTCPLGWVQPLGPLARSKRGCTASSASSLPWALVTVLGSGVQASGGSYDALPKDAWLSNCRLRPSSRTCRRRTCCSTSCLCASCASPMRCSFSAFSRSSARPVMACWEKAST